MQDWGSLIIWTARRGPLGTQLPEPMPALLAGMETYDSVVEMEETSSTFDVPLTSLETFVREQVASQTA